MIGYVLAPFVLAAALLLATLAALLVALWLCWAAQRILAGFVRVIEGVDGLPLLPPDVVGKRVR